MQVEGSKKPRQRHRKSRDGCTTCKKRHIKCDEKRPDCGNCSISGRECHYASPKQAKTGTSPYETELTLLSSSHPTSIFPESSVSPTPDLEEVESEDLFTLDHLNLLCHVKEHMRDWLMVTDKLVPLADGYLTTALKTPYLMNQLLALSAMHLRSVNNLQPNSYMQTATRLRRRALRGFNKHIDDTSEINSTSQFFFASLLALHYLAETITDLGDGSFAASLDCTLNYFRLQRGARIMGERAIPSFSNSPVAQWMINASRERLEEPKDNFQGYAMIASMLEISELNEDSRKACKEAVDALDFVKRRVGGPNGWGVHAMMAWSNLIPWHFLTLLEKQIPEALVILAHWAVLMHQFRTFWCFNDLGQRLVDGISGALAGYWASWLPDLEDDVH